MIISTVSKKNIICSQLKPLILEKIMTKFKKKYKYISYLINNYILNKWIYIEKRIRREKINGRTWKV